MLSLYVLNAFRETTLPCACMVEVGELVEAYHQLLDLLGMLPIHGVQVSGAHGGQDGHMSRMPT